MIIMPWGSRGLRGSTLEEYIDLTNRKYRERGLALVKKIPTPITPVKFDGETRNITLAYFDEKSTVDYIGVVQGVPVCFDAKETGGKYLPLQNIHEHQIEFMADFEKQGGIAFLLVYFRPRDEFFYLPFAALREFWDGANKGRRKSIPYEAFERKYLIQNKSGFYIHYLEAINKDLEDR